MNLRAIIFGRGKGQAPNMLLCSSKENHRIDRTTVTHTLSVELCLGVLVMNPTSCFRSLPASAAYRDPAAHCIQHDSV